MTKIEIILALVAALSVIWAGIVTLIAVASIKKSKNKAAYYQQPGTQIKIARHVIRQKWYTDNLEVFR